MRVTAAVLILSFFVPVVCSVQSAWSASSRSCGNMNHTPQPAPMVSPCCLNAAIERPALQEVSRSDEASPTASAVPERNVVLPESGNRSVVEVSRNIDRHKEFPRLYVLHAAFLI